MFKTATALMILGAAAALPAYGQTATTRPAATAPARAGAAAPQALASGQFPTEAAAKTHCPGDSIVWANLGGSKAYHTSADRYYGKTRHGAYMCQKEADQAGYHTAGSRARKSAAKTTAKTTSGSQTK
jgi:hypothetical protein